MAEIENIRIGDSSAVVDYSVTDDGNTIVVDAIEDALDTVQDFIREKLLKYNCDKKPLLQIRLAVEEIFVNIISYAYKPGIGKAEIMCVVSEDPLMVTLQFMDSGKPFDPLKADDADTSGAMFMEHEGGFGIHLVKNIMDSVEYEYKDGKNTLLVKKSL